VMWALKVEGAKKPASVTTGSVAKAPDRPDEYYCVFATPQPSGLSPLYIGGEIGTFEGEEILIFDYWVDSEVQMQDWYFNFYNRTLQKNVGGVPPTKLTPGKWTRMELRLADAGTADTKFRPGDFIGGIYMHVGGGATRRFYIDNLQFVRPRAKK